MHPLQRRSLFAIISMIETGLQQLKSILAANAEDPEHVVHKPSPAPGHGEYMSEDEEEQFEKLLEEDRRKLAEEHNRKIAAFWKDQD